jgi:hypothetical protein
LKHRNGDPCGRRIRALPPVYIEIVQLLEILLFDEWKNERPPPDEFGSWVSGTARRSTRRGEHAKRVVEAVKGQPKPPPAGLPISIANVFRAVWTVNRSAKRYRDAAESTYQKGVYPFATSKRRRKEQLYALKDRGIRWLAQRSVIVASCIHGRLCLWCGRGYSFHSTLVPPRFPMLAQDQAVFIEAKPKSVDDLRVRDAEDLLSRLPSDSLLTFDRLELPSLASRRTNQRVELNEPSGGTRLQHDDFDGDYSDDEFEDDVFEDGRNSEWW